ncbi:peptidylprolyl isomerase [Aridibaculum aurantiacum]|uniref:peptidylprolyl isomerase n=1 Tax=Aridibaculum aurantiacum TaxID=2810307 RepID=UPI001A970FD4|nr:peptidylprolyl isomerase [Aridibaculum aurantiacum]
MSVIQKIRDKYAAVVIAVIALSLIGFILMDAFVGRGSGMGSRSTVVGKVNGEKIDHNEFERKINVAQTMYGQQARREQLIGNVWEQTIDEIVMKQAYDELGLQFTDKELNDVLFGPNAPQWLKNEFTDPATGEFKVNDAKAYFANIKKQQNNPNLEMFQEVYILPTISQGLRQKYMALLSQSAYVPKWMAEKTVADQNAIASFSYVAVPYSSIADTAIKVSDDDVKAYINKHPEQFKQEEASRSISYVSFNATASAEDTAAILNQLSTLRDEFATTTDNEGFINRVTSEIPFFDGYTQGSKMQMSNADAIRNLANGEVYGPYIDANNFVLAKMIDRRQMPDSVKVRHILVKTGEQGRETLSDSIAKARIDSIQRAIQGGADFNSMVVQYSDDQGSKETRGEYDFSSTQFGGLSREFAEVAFYGKTGDKRVVKVENASYSGYHYIEVLNQKGFEPAFKVAYLAKPIDASQSTINAASAVASQFAGSSRNKKQFEENANKQGLQPLQIMDVKPNDYAVPGLGENRSLVRWIYENKAGDVSEPFEVGEKYVVALITGVSEKGLMSVSRARPSAEPLIINEKKAQQIINTKFKGGATLEAIAQGAGQTVQRADSVSFAQPFIPQIGNEPKVTGAAFNKSLQGKISEPIAGNSGVFVVRGESVGAQANTGINVEDTRRQMEMQYKQMSGYRSMEALKKAAKVTDNRFDFY